MKMTGTVKGAWGWLSKQEDLPCMKTWIQIPNTHVKTQVWPPIAPMLWGPETGMLLELPVSLQLRWGTPTEGINDRVVEQDIGFLPLISACAYMTRIFRHIHVHASPPSPNTQRVVRELRFYPTFKLTSEPATLLDAGKGHRICSLGTKVLELELQCSVLFLNQFQSSKSHRMEEMRVSDVCT